MRQQPTTHATASCHTQHQDDAPVATPRVGDACGRSAVRGGAGCVGGAWASALTPAVAARCHRIMCRTAPTCSGFPRRTHDHHHHHHRHHRTRHTLRYRSRSSAPGYRPPPLLNHATCLVRASGGAAPPDLAVAGTGTGTGTGGRAGTCRVRLSCVARAATHPGCDRGVHVGTGAGPCAGLQDVSGCGTQARRQCRQWWSRQRHGRRQQRQQWQPRIDADDRQPARLCRQCRERRRKEGEDGGGQG